MDRGVDICRAASRYFCASARIAARGIDPLTDELVEFGTQLVVVV